MPIQLLVALCLAVLLNMKVRYVNVFRTVYYIPTVTPAVANVFLWVWIFNFDFGLINSLLRVVGDLAGQLAVGSADRQTGADPDEPCGRWGNRW